MEKYAALIFILAAFAIVEIADWHRRRASSPKPSLPQAGPYRTGATHTALPNPNVVRQASPPITADEIVLRLETIRHNLRKNAQTLAHPSIFVRLDVEAKIEDICDTLRDAEKEAFRFLEQKSPSPDVAKKIAISLTDIRQLILDTPLLRNELDGTVDQLNRTIADFMLYADKPIP